MAHREQKNQIPHRHWRKPKFSIFKEKNIKRKMMLKLSLISLFLLFVGYTVGDTTTASSMTVANTMMNLNSKATTDSETMPNHQTTLIPTMTPNSKTTSQSNPKKTVKTAVTSQIATTMNTTTMKNDGITLNPSDKVHFLFYVIFLLFCVH